MFWDLRPKELIKGCHHPASHWALRNWIRRRKSLWHPGASPVLSAGLPCPLSLESLPPCGCLSHFPLQSFPPANMLNPAETLGDLYALQNHSLIVHSPNGLYWASTMSQTLPRALAALCLVFLTSWNWRLVPRQATKSIHRHFSVTRSGLKATFPKLQHVVSPLLYGTSHHTSRHMVWQK